MWILSLKESLKMALSVVLVTCIAHILQWEKPYWAIMTVVAIAVSDSYGHALKKMHFRLIGTLFGIVFALSCIFLFSNHIEILCLLGFLFFIGCSYWNNKGNYGDLFAMSFVVFAIIFAMGHLERTISLEVSVLRVQETLLGVVVYSLVFAFIWHESTETLFFSKVDLITKDLELASKQFRTKNEDNLSIDFTNAQSHLKQLTELLRLPLMGSSRLKKERKQWQNIMLGYAMILGRIQAHPYQPVEIVTIQAIAKMLSLSRAFQQGQPFDALLYQKMEEELALIPLSHPEDVLDTNAGKVQRTNTLKSVLTLITCLPVCIFLPSQFAILFMLISSILALFLATMPKSIIKHGLVGTVGWGVLFVLQYQFITPMLTEFWQHCLFYAVNVFIIWFTCSKPSLGIQKILASNMMVLLTMNIFNSNSFSGLDMFSILMMSVLITLLVGLLYHWAFSLGGTTRKSGSK